MLLLVGCIVCSYGSICLMSTRCPVIFIGSENWHLSGVLVRQALTDVGVKGQLSVESRSLLREL